MFERRQHPRVKDPEVGATLMTANGREISCTVHDLSAGGARLVASGTVEVGERVRVVLTYGYTQPTRLTGTVMRVEELDEQSSHIALKFDVVTDPVQRAIQGILLRAIERKRALGRQSALRL